MMMMMTMIIFGRKLLTGSHGQNARLNHISPALLSPPSVSANNHDHDHDEQDDHDHDDHDDHADHSDHNNHEEDEDRVTSIRLRK